MATGGTIAGSGAGAAASGVYSAGSIGVEALVDGMSQGGDIADGVAVPDLLNISNVRLVDVCLA
jgi:L-asparaginase